MQDTALRITKVARQPEGHWTANVSCDGSTTAVHNRYGAWATNADPDTGRFSHVPYPVAVKLQAKLPRQERGVYKR